jgi:hypothetical protein
MLPGTGFLIEGTATENANALGGAITVEVAPVAAADRIEGTPAGGTE